jgi:hypothetical protein
MTIPMKSPGGTDPSHNRRGIAPLLRQKQVSGAPSEHGSEQTEPIMRRLMFSCETVLCHETSAGRFPADGYLSYSTRPSCPPFFSLFSRRSSFLLSSRVVGWSFVLNSLFASVPFIDLPLPSIPFASAISSPCSMQSIDFFGQVGNAGHRHYPFVLDLLQFEIRIGLQNLPANCQKILMIFRFRPASSGLILESSAKPLPPSWFDTSPRTEIQPVAAEKVHSP